MKPPKKSPPPRPYPKRYVRERAPAHPLERYVPPTPKKR